MLFKYYKKMLNYEELSSTINRDEKHRVNIFDLSIAIKKQNLNPSIVFFNYKYFEDSKFLEDLETLKEDTFILTSIKNAVKNKVNLKHKIFFIEDIENLIKKNKLVITLISVGEFRNIKLKKWRGHFIVITGFDDNYFYYNDPHWDDRKFGKHKIGKGRLIAAIFRTQFPAILWVENES